MSVSVVLPTHNGARFLEESIRSVMNQTHSDWELILVDDHSSDATASMIERWTKSDSRITSLRPNARCYLPAALNAGFSRCRGELLTWTSDDNRYHPEALQTMVRVLEQQPEVDIVYTGWSIIDEGGARCERPSAVPSTLLRGNSVGPCFLYRRKVHEAMQYDESRFLVEDLDFWLRAAERFRFAAVPDELYEYRLHRASLTVTRRAEIYRATVSLYLEWLTRQTMLSRRERAECLLWLTNLSIQAGDYGRVGQLARRAMLQGRAPFLFSNSRSLVVDALMGYRCGAALRAASRYVRGRRAADI